MGMCCSRSANNAEFVLVYEDKGIHMGFTFSLDCPNRLARDDLALGIKSKIQYSHVPEFVKREIYNCRFSINSIAWENFHHHPVELRGIKSEIKIF